MSWDRRPVGFLTCHTLRLRAGRTKGDHEITSIPLHAHRLVCPQPCQELPILLIALRVSPPAALGLAPSALPPSAAAMIFFITSWFARLFVQFMSKNNNQVNFQFRNSGLKGCSGCKCQRMLITVQDSPAGGRGVYKNKKCIYIYTYIVYITVYIRRSECCMKSRLNKYMCQRQNYLYSI